MFVHARIKLSGNIPHVVVQSGHDPVVRAVV